eukprot:2160376-Karenia_brevis.AAC.1
MAEFRLDKIGFTLPPWAIAQFVIKLEVLGTPCKFFQSGISDHAPISLTCSFLALPPADLPPPIPHFVCKHPRFAELSDTFLSAARLDLIADPFARLEKTKSVLREVGCL